MSDELIINSEAYRDMTLTTVDMGKLVQLNLSNSFWSTSEQISLTKSEAIKLRNFLNEFIEANNE